MKGWMAANQHPLEKMTINAREKRRKCHKENNPEDRDPLVVKDQLKRMLKFVSSLPFCYNMDRNDFNKSCSCCRLISDELINSCVTFFSNQYCLMERRCREVVEKAMMDAAESDRKYQKQFQAMSKKKHSVRYTCNFRLNFYDKAEDQIFVCTQTWRILFCVRRTRWLSLKKSLEQRGISPSPVQNA